MDTMNSVSVAVPSLFLLPHYPSLKLDEYSLSAFHLMVWFQFSENRLHQFLNDHPSELSENARHLYEHEASVFIDKERFGSGEALTVALDGAIRCHPQATRVAFSFPVAIKDGQPKRQSVQPQHGPGYFVAQGLDDFLKRDPSERGRINQIYLMPHEQDSNLTLALRYNLARRGHSLRHVEYVGSLS